MSFDVFRCDDRRRRDARGAYVAVVPRNSGDAHLLVRACDVMTLREQLLVELLRAQPVSGAFARQESLMDSTEERI